MARWQYFCSTSPPAPVWTEADLWHLGSVEIFDRSLKGESGRQVRAGLQLYICYEVH